MTDVDLVAGDLSFLDEQTLNEWIVAQRWFASKTREVSHIAIADAVPLRDGVPAAGAVPGRGALPGRDARDLPGAARLPAGGDGWEQRVIYEADGWTVYDALADPAAGRELLHAMRSNRESRPTRTSSSSAGPRTPAPASAARSTCGRSASSSPTPRSSSATS